MTEVYHTHLPDHPRANQYGNVWDYYLAAEDKLGRHLLPAEEVFHINACQTDNRPENLMVFRTRGDLVRFLDMGLLIDHEDGTYSSPLRVYTRQCVVCQTKFSTASPHQEVCCDECYYTHSGRTPLPSRDRLTFYMAQYSVREVAKKMRTSPEMVRSWCRRLNVTIDGNPKLLVDNGAYHLPDLRARRGGGIKKFKNVAHAVSFLRLYDKTSAPPEYVRKGIFAVLRGEKPVYLGYKWESKIFHYRNMCTKGEFEVE